MPGCLSAAQQHNQPPSPPQVEDLADMMARVPGNRDAVYEHFNLCSDRCITFDGGPRLAPPGARVRVRARACVRQGGQRARRAAS